MDSKRQYYSQKEQSKARTVKKIKTVVTKGIRKMYSKIKPTTARFTSNHSSSANQNYVSFDKIIEGGWVKDPVELGLLENIKDEKNRVVFEFKLNNKKFDAWSSKTTWGAKNKNLLKIGHRYILKGTMKAEAMNRKLDIYSTSNFNFKVLLAKVTVESEIPDQENIQRRPSDPNQLMTIKHINEQIGKRMRFKDLKLEDVEILSGDVRRYMGCNDCFAGLPTPSKNGHYYCSFCNKRTKSRKKKERRICIVIRNIELKDKHGDILKNALCFQRQCESLFGEVNTKKLCKATTDMDARKEFESMIGSKLNVAIKHQVPTTKSSSKKRFVNSKIVIESLEVTVKNKKPIPNTHFQNVELSLQTSFKTKAKCCPCQEGFESDEDDGGDDDEIKHFLPDLISQLPPRKPKRYPLNTSGEVYDLKETPEGFVGLALIINMTFRGGEKPRHGSNRDVKRLHKLLPNLGIRIFCNKVFQDLDYEDFQNHVESFKEELISGEYSSMFFIIMSHGSLYNIHLSDERLNIYADIKPLFGETKFSEFLGKPKIFVFNACQSFVDDKAIFVDDTEVVPDVLECFPCEPGIKAKRNRSEGSYFIQTMADVLEQYYNTHHIEQMMKIVQDKMRNIRLGELNTSINIPEYKPKLFGKKFYFRRNLDLEDQEDTHFSQMDTT